MSTTKSSGPLRAARWSKADGMALIRPGGERLRFFERQLAAPKEFSYSGGTYSSQGGSGTTATTTDTIFGSGQHYRITTGATSGNTQGFRYRWTSSNGPNLSWHGGIIIPVRVEAIGAAASSEVLLQISNSVSSGTANVAQTRYLQNGLLGDQFVYFPIDKFTAAGTPTQAADGTSTYDFVLYIVNRTTGTATQCLVGPPQLSCGVRPKISLGWDDGLISTYTEAFPMMAAAGLRGTLSVAKDYVGTSGYMTEAQITRLYDAGWNIVVHGVLAHTDASITTRAQLLAEVARNQAYIAEKWPGGERHYTYPGGALVNDWSISVLQELGFVTARLVNRGYPMGVGVGMTSASWLLMASNPTLDANVATRLTDISDAVSGKWPITEMHMHSVNPVSPETGVETTSRTNAQSVVDAVAAAVAAGDMDCVTREEMYLAFA